MVDLMLAGDTDDIRRKGIVLTVYDPCCGSGGMLMITKEHVTIGLRKNGDLLRGPINKDAEIHLFGQEVNPETWAVSKSDFFMKDPTGRDADNVAFGSTLSNDRHANKHFDYLIANPPYGKDWKRDEDSVRAEHERGTGGRFAPGLPRISDGQLLSPLFTGDAGSGESEIRRFILENDLLEALICSASPSARSFAPRFAVGLRYVHSSDWVRSVGFLPERKRQFAEPQLYAIRLNVRKVLTIYPRCALVEAAPEQTHESEYPHG